MPQGRRRHKKESAGFKPWQRLREATVGNGDELESCPDLYAPKPIRVHSPLDTVIDQSYRPTLALLVKDRPAPPPRVNYPKHMGGFKRYRDRVAPLRPAADAGIDADKYRKQLLAIAPSIRPWIPEPTPEPKIRTLADESDPPVRSERYRPDPEAERRAQYPYEKIAFDEWRDREANPDDYEAESTTCECGEEISFYLTGSGTVTEWCPNCGVVKAGANYSPIVRAPVPGASGERRPLTQQRRFWQVSWVPSRKGKVCRQHEGLRSAPSRIWVPQQDVVTLLSSEVCRQTNPKYLKRQSAYIHIVEAARTGQPISAPVPEGITPTAFREKVSQALQRHRSTMLARWSVCRVVQDGKEMLRIGPIGT